jgi:callose synthase
LYFIGLISISLETVSTNSFCKTYADLYEALLAIEQGKNKRNIHQALAAELEALADMKFSYVISCQKFGEQKIKGDPHAQDIIDLMMRYEITYIALEHR